MAFNFLKGLFKKREIENELNQLLIKVEEDPDNPKLRMKLANLYIKNNQVSKGIEEYLKSAKKYSEDGYFTMVVAIYKKVIKLAPQKVGFYLELAEIYRKMKFLGDTVNIYENLINYYKKRGEEAKVQELLGKIVELSPKLSHIKPKSQTPAQKRATRRAAKKKEQEGFFDLAAALDSDKSLEIDEEKVAVLDEEHGLGVDEVFAEIKKSLKEKEEDLETHYNLGIALKDMGMLDDAIVEFKIASKAPNLQTECYIALGLCYLEKNMTLDAAKYFRDGLKVDKFSRNDFKELIVKIKEANLKPSLKTKLFPEVARIYQNILSKKS